MNFFRKMGNSFARFMYGRNGMDRLNLALLWAGIAADVAAMLLTRRFPVAGTVFYNVSLIVWIWAVFRMLSRNLYKRQSENGRWMTLCWKMKNLGGGSRARRADHDHRYFTCKNCRAVCRVPKGKGKIVITCPKCGAQIHAKT